MLRALFLAAAVALACGAARAASPEEQARALLEGGRAQEAYRLLAREEPARAGDPRFDYLLGIAALDAGRPEHAVVALERVLAVEPGHLQARAEIGRAYLALGERETARRELEAVREAPIPGEAKATIDRLLSAIAATATTRFSASLEAGLGYDSNVNTATSASRIALPILGGVIATLDPAARARDDLFAAVSGAGSLAWRLGPEWSLVGAASLAFKQNRDESEFDTRTLDASAGARWQRAREALAFGAQLQDFALDGDAYRRARGVVAQWQHAFEPRRQATLFAQWSRLEYPGERVRDADRAIAGAVYAHAFLARFSPVAFATVYFGEERARDAAVPHLGHEPLGLRLGAELRPAPRWTLFGSLSLEERRYGGTEPVFLARREDRQVDATAGAIYRLGRSLALVAQLTRVDSDSNIELFAFQRTVASASLRWSLAP